MNPVTCGCEFCGDPMPVARITEEDGSYVELCRACLNDVRYCRAGGRIPQEEE